MEGGNGATSGSGITHSPERRTKRLSCTRTLLSRLAAVPCRIAGIMDNLFRRTTPPTRWIAAVSAAKYLFSRKERKDRKEMEGGNGANVKWKAVMERPAGAELRFYNNRAAVKYF